MEQANHLWRTGADFEDVLPQLNYRGLEEVPTTNLWWTNLMNQMTHVPAGERIVVSEREVLDRNRVRRLENKSIAVMKDMVSNFSKPRHVIADLCAGTLATAKDCMMLSQHSRFIECEVNTDCSNQRYTSVVEKISRQALNEEFRHHRIGRSYRSCNIVCKRDGSYSCETRKVV